MRLGQTLAITLDLFVKTVDFKRFFSNGVDVAAICTKMAKNRLGRRLSCREFPPSSPKTKENTEKQLSYRQPLVFAAHFALS